MSAPSTPQRPWRTRLLALTASTLVTVVACEALCRLRVQRLNSETLQASLERPVAMSAGGQATLGDLIQLSPNDRIAYELRADLPGVTFKDRPVTTNSLGFRSTELPQEAGPDTVTIVGIGDSVMFGHGVGDGECYLDQLQGLLSRRHPERTWRIVNTGVPGYNTVMEVETLVQKGLAFEPDLVLVGVVGNDYEPPVYVRDALDPWDLSRSYLLEFVREKLDGGDEASHLRRTGMRHRGSDEAPPRYANLYGEEAFQGAVRRLAALWDEHAFELLAFSNITYCEPPYDHNRAREMLAYMTEAGLPALDLQYVLDAAMESRTGRAFAIEDYIRSDLVVSENNGHPSVLAHGLLAEVLYIELEKAGVLARLLD